MFSSAVSLEAAPGIYPKYTPSHGSCAKVEPTLENMLEARIPRAKLQNIRDTLLDHREDVVTTFISKQFSHASKTVIADTANQDLETSRLTSTHAMSPITS